VSKLIGLRSQLLLGLLIMVLVATFSVGAISILATRWQVAETKLTDGRILAQALARSLAPALQRPCAAAAGPRSDGRRARTGGCVDLQRVVGGMAAWSRIRRVEVVDRALGRLAQGGTGSRPAEQTLLRQTLHTGQQRFRLLEQGVLAVSSPIGAGAQVSGALWLELDVGQEELRLPALFWVLTGFDALVLVLFVGFVLTRHVVRPVELMQRAALRVTEGDLEARVEPAGAAELVSLAESFNTMTSYLRDQLGRLEHQRQELVVTREQVIHSEKLASVGRLAAGVAHEVGNPLQAIMGLTEMLRRGGLSEQQREDFFQRMQGETQRIHRIVRELLDYARPVEEAVEPVDLEAIVAQSIQLLQPQQRAKQVAVESAGLARMPRAAANAQRLVQVVVNLLLNAADAMSGQGEVTIRGREIEPEQVELSVSNDGPPIPVEDRGQIFDPFFTTKEPGDGTGLGLSVAQSIVESYGGRLVLAEGEQTTFLITLPRWSEEG